jgi:hypothetical protein
MFIGQWESAAIHYASYKGRTSIAHKLIRHHGANINLRGNVRDILDANRIASFIRNVCVGCEV